MNQSSLLDIASFSPRSLEFPNAWIGHLPFAAWLTREVAPKIFVELGTHSGNSYFSFCQSVLESSLSTKCYAVDTWEGDEHAGSYSDNVFSQVNAHNQLHYASFSRLLRMKFDDAVSYFSDGSIDLLHIDGLHTYEAVQHDFETWLPKLAPGAIVLFHDTNVREKGFGVWRLWEKLQAHYPNNIEFLHSHGLGVLQLNGASDANKQNWLNPEPGEQQQLKDYFSQLGAHQLERFELNQNKTHITNLNQAIIARDGQNTTLNYAVIERDTHISNLSQIIVERDTHIANLSQIIIERDTRIANIGQIITERDEQIARLSDVVAERNQVIAALSQSITEIFQSTSWRITNPLRFIGKLVVGGANNTKGLMEKVRGAYQVCRHLIGREPLPRLLKKGSRIWQQDGLSGLITRMRAQYRIHDFSKSPSALLSSQLASVFIIRTPEGQYRLSSESRGYTYLEPQKPDNIDSKIARLSVAPLFSIVVPIYNTPPELLEAALSSVLTQWYPRWQLILVNDSSTKKETRDTLNQINHPQIEVLHLEKNLGISGATNVGLDTAKGDFIVFMDHDDELTVDCLYELALCIERENPDFIYSDEDKLSETGDYTEPHFKPDWSPDTMMSTMYTCHVSSIRRSLVKKVGGLRTELDGCQDWDFVLRVTEQTTRISHIPKVLYHWRITPASIASSLAAKPYVLEASQQTRIDALTRRGLSGQVEAVLEVPGYFRVAYELKDKPLISIIIPTRDNESVLRRCVDSILAQTRYQRFELIILDNGSIEPKAVEYLKELGREPSTTVIRHAAPFNYSELNNLGARKATGEILLFLNDDTEVLQEDWLERLGGFAQLPHIGAAGAKLLYPGGIKVQHAGILNLADGPGHAFLKQGSDSPGYYLRNLLEYNWLAVTGACLMIEKCKFESIGGFAESLPVAYNDIDLCMRLCNSGHYNVVVPAVRLLHHESASRGIDDIDPAKMARLKLELASLYERNPQYYQHDPFHNPNLHPNGINFELPA